MQNRILLGVNIDHIATIRQARKEKYPDPTQAAMEAEQAGADAITLHLREDRRHIKDRDVYLIREVLKTRMNFEMALTDEMLLIAEQVQPECVCLVPEKREEVTTEGGLDVIASQAKISSACQRLQNQGIEVSLFIDPDRQQVNAAIDSGASTIELHTGVYALCKNRYTCERELNKLMTIIDFAKSKGLIVNAGHGLTYHNVEPIAALKGINELNIGYAIVSRALFVGLRTAVIEMKSLINRVTIT